MAEAGWKLVWTAGGAICVLLLAATACVATIGFFWTIGTAEDLPTTDAIASVFVDELVESGALAPATEPDGPLIRERAVLLTYAINERSSRDVVEQLLRLDALDPATPIDLYLSSPGGWGGSAFTILDAIHAIDAPVNAHALGQCYSACALVLVASTGRRTASETVLFMLHANVDDSTEPFSYERLNRSRYEKIWREHSSVPDEWFPMTRDEAYYFSAEEALAFGVIDEILPVKRRDPREAPPGS